MKMSPDVNSSAPAKKQLQRDETLANSNRQVRASTTFSSIKHPVEVTAQSR